MRFLDHVYDITGGLCENNDKFAVDRSMPAMEIGDLVAIHDTGAHGFPWATIITASSAVRKSCYTQTALGPKSAGRRRRQITLLPWIARPSILKGKNADSAYEVVSAHFCGGPL